jgi:hypothetical protein
MTGTFQLSESLAPTRRAIVSVAVPDEKPTMMRMGLAG